MEHALRQAYSDEDAVVASVPQPLDGARSLLSILANRPEAKKLARLTDHRFRRRELYLRQYLADLGETPSHVHCFGHLVASPSVLGTAGLPYSVSIDGTWLQYRSEFGASPSMIDASRQWRRAKAERQIFEEATFISCASNWAARSVVDDYKIDESKVWVDPIPIPAVTASVERVTDASWLTFIGNDFHRKGGHRLLAWHQRELSHLAELHVVSSATRPPDLRRYENVVWHGVVPNEQIRAEILPQTAVLALPTSIDQSPLVLTEAAAAGVASVATELAGIPEIVIDGVSGFTIKRDDSPAFVAAIKTLLEDRSLAAQMGAAAHLHYSNSLCSKKTTDNLLRRVKGSYV